MADLSGDTDCISAFIDGDGAVSFNIDVNGDAFGSTHNGSITCARPVRIVAQKHRDGNGHYDGSANGNIFSWHTQCGSGAGIHMTIELAY